MDTTNLEKSIKEFNDTLLLFLDTKKELEYIDFCVLTTLKQKFIDELLTLKTKVGCNITDVLFDLRINILSSYSKFDRDRLISWVSQNSMKLSSLGDYLSAPSVN